MSDSRQFLPILFAHAYGRDHIRHINTFGHIEPAMSLRGCNSGGEGAKRFAFLDHRVDSVPHLEMTWVREDASIAECARPELHSSTIPSYDAAFSDQLRGPLASCG